MKEYDLIIIGTGSAMNLVDPFLRQNHHAKVAVIDKDEPGGICLTRGCIPSKIILYPAELVREIEKAKELNIDVTINEVDFKGIMQRMRETIGKDIESIRSGLSHVEELDYYADSAEFIDSYTLKVGNEKITSKLIFLCTGSKPTIPPIKNLEHVDFHTSTSILKLEELPKSMVIIGGGYIAAEYGHFFAAMGTKITIIGRNSQFLPGEEPEISTLALRELSEHMKIYTNYEVVEVKQSQDENKIAIAKNKDTGESIAVEASEILVAAGRTHLNDLLKPEKSDIEVTEKGWIKVNKYLETSQPGIWAFGDATGEHLFKHVANYESKVVYYNALGGQKLTVDYHAVPHAVFTYPEIAGVGMREEEAIEKYGKANIRIGFQKYENTAKGEAMAVHDYFVKIILKAQEQKILGAHIIGPQASVLIQEVINLMYTHDQSAFPIDNGMHIHPALSEVVERAFYNLMGVEQYHELLEHDKLHS